jgi:ATP-dependent helicase HrpA
MSVDYPRLQRELDRWRPEQPDAATRLAAIAAAIEASVAQSETRRARLPDLTVPENLPIAARSAEIVAAIQQHRVLIVVGETGSGKTTQLPKLCLKAGRGLRGWIGCTQPRRIAARSMARRLAQELNSAPGQLVGSAVRFSDEAPPQTLVKFMTDGILLAETQSDRDLRRYDTILIDEAHERSLNIDFLLGYLKRLLARRPDLKLIVASATIDTERFTSYFDGAPVIRVEGRAYPVEVRWRPISGDREERSDIGLHAAIADAVEEYWREDPQGDVLVFLPGEREIRDVHQALEKHGFRHTEILPLYARLSAAAQDRVFAPGTSRRIVLATNVAETSITVPRIRCVIDSGLARVNRYSQRAKVQRLQIEPISQAAAQQRAGRAGRTAPGVCIRLYDEQDYARRAPYTDPELLRSQLAGVILRMLDLGLGDPLAFPFLDPPGERAVRDGYALLAELGALDERRQLSAVGREMARLPIDVRLARFLVAARERGVLDDALVIAAGLSVQDPRERPPAAEALADAAHRAFVHEKSDLLTLLQLWQAFDHAFEELTQSQLRAWCKERFLSFLRLREWRELHRQLLLICRERGWRQESATAESPLTDARAYEALHRAFLSAYATQVARKDERQRYRGPRGRRLAIFPGSGQAKVQPNWIVAAQLLETQKLYALHVARIEPGWIEAAAKHLVTKRHYDPSWDARAGRAVGFEDVLLFGLPIVERRRIAYAPVDPVAARQLFVRHQLVHGEGPARHPVLAANARVRAAAQAKEDKLRRRGLILDDEALARWFDERCPTEILDSQQLLAWLRRASPAEQDRIRLTLDDLLVPEARSDERAEFPDELAIEGARLTLSYAFAPGGERDGVIVRVPLAALPALTPAMVEWLIPGWRGERAALLIKSLPKALRRHVVPAPDYARAFLEATPPAQAPFPEALAAFLTRVSGVEIRATDFDPSGLPPYLRPLIEVIGEGGEVLAAGRDLAALQERCAEAAGAAFAARVDALYQREKLNAWPLPELPREVRAAGGARAYPALVDVEGTVALRAFAQSAEAELAHPRGVRRLLLLRMAEVLRHETRNCKLSGEAQLAWGVFASVEALRRELVEAAFDRVLGDPSQVRSAAGFTALEERVRREIGPALQALVPRVDAILKTVKALRAALDPPLMGFAAANLADAREHLARLVHPGFLHGLPLARLEHYPRYLEALRRRVDRLKRDPARDQQRLLEVQPFERALERLRAARPGDPAVDRLRWQIEEFRVSLFAQELGTAEPVSAKRIAKAMAALEAEEQHRTRDPAPDTR